jgi:hypothetical protein
MAEHAKQTRKKILDEFLGNNFGRLGSFKQKFKEFEKVFEKYEEEFKNLDSNLAKNSVVNKRHAVYFNLFHMCESEYNSILSKYNALTGQNKKRVWDIVKNVIRNHGKINEEIAEYEGEKLLKDSIMLKSIFEMTNNAFQDYKKCITPKLKD